MEFTLGDLTCLQCLLQQEIVKSACMVADVCKRTAGFGKMYNSKIKTLNCKIKVLNSTKLQFHFAINTVNLWDPTE